MGSAKRPLLKGERASRHQPSSGVVELPEGVQLFEVCSEVTMAAHSGVMVQVWRGRASVDAFERLAGYYRTFCETHPRYVGLVVMEPHHIAPPETAARQRAAELLKSQEGALAGLGFLIEGTGIKYSVMRFSLTTISLLSASSVPQSVFATLAEACAWLGSILDGVSPSVLERVVEELRSLPVPE